MRHGATVLEISIGAVIGIVVLGFVVSMLTGAHRGVERAGRRLARREAAHTALVRLRDVLGDALEVEVGAAVVLGGAAAPARLRFTTAGVRYALHLANGRLELRRARAPAELLASGVTDLTVRLHDAVVELSLDVGGCVVRDHVLLRATLVPELADPLRPELGAPARASPVS